MRHKYTIFVHFIGKNTLAIDLVHNLEVLVDVLNFLQLEKAISFVDHLLHLADIEEDELDNDQQYQ